MPDEIKVGAAKFNRILDRMLEAKLQSKAEISARIKSARGGGNREYIGCRGSSPIILGNSSRKVRGDHAVSIIPIGGIKRGGIYVLR